MGQCLSDEMKSELANQLDITHDELVQTANNLGIEMTPELADVAHYSIEDLPRDVTSFESYRRHVESIATEYNQKWETLQPEASAYEATAVTWEAAHDEFERALEEADIVSECEEADLAMAQNGIPLPLAVLQKASEARGWGQESN